MKSEKKLPIWVLGRNLLSRWHREVGVGLEEDGRGRGRPERVRKDTIKICVRFVTKFSRKESSRIVANSCQLFFQF